MSSETTNALAAASSSYLRSAMHQPIRWHEWGPEAFAAAQRENKPVLLDIGAVWCHWCHVMDRESYENPKIAEVVNEHFIAVKVDRDERPDVDSRYQAAVSAISGQGGWPLTAFLTPDGRPFYGGTYFPPEDQYGRPGFRRVLEAIAGAWREKRDHVLQSAASVMTAIGQAEAFTGRSAEFSPRIIESIVQSAVQMFDLRHGGFGQAPKFPHPAVMDLILDRYARTRESYLRTVADTTLEKMARGGVYDQLAGGFHRYSVDERWVVPHFEKMSYDNSELLKNYVHGYQATGNAFFAAVARDILRWMDEWLSDHRHGGFYASQDADYSLDDDGDYFTWTQEEARAVLTADELEAVIHHYDLAEVGEMHHNPAKNVLFVHATPAEIAVRLGTQTERVEALLDSAKKKMLAARLQRPTPYVDKTVYVNWNALCVSAYLEAARVLNLPEARRFALRSLDRILAEGWDAKQGLRHVIAYSEAQPAAGGPHPAATPRRSPVRGLLDDYAFTVCACLDAYEATAALSYFTFAQHIAEAMIAKFYDPMSGGFFDTERPYSAGDAPQALAAGSETASGDGALGALAARRKPFQDSPTPAGNSAAVIALMRLYGYTHDESLREKAEQTLEVFAGLAPQFGMFAGTYGIAAVWFANPPLHVVVVGNDELAQKLYDAAVRPFALNKVALHLTDSEIAPQNLPPALAETIPNLPAVREGKSAAVICAGFTCRAPIFEPDQLTRALEETLAATKA
ncbi:MAG TPA: thioredoxin domain-containing protein [Terriglobales bacterium]|nr:thioredoxin domain-containing protein [Terriglobales bacterium]